MPTSHYIMSYHIMSHHIISHHITSHYIISHHITSHHIILHHSLYHTHILLHAVLCTLYPVPCKVRPFEAIDHCFGREKGQYFNIGSAYMLVYIRESDATMVSTRTCPVCTCSFFRELVWTLFSMNITYTVRTVTAL